MLLRDDGSDSAVATDSPVEAVSTVAQTEQAEQTTTPASTTQAELDEDKTPNTVTVPEDLQVAEDGDLTIDEIGQNLGIIFLNASITSEEEGECIYNFTADDTRPITQTNQSYIQGDVQVCYVDLNEAEFTKLGQWRAEVIFTSGSKSYKATEEFNVQ